MSLTLRQVKGSKLTIEEMDENLRYLNLKLPRLIALPKIITTPILIENNQIGISAGGFTLSEDGSVTTDGNGYVLILPI